MEILSTILAVAALVTLVPGAAAAAPPRDLSAVLDQAVRDGYPGVLAYVRQGDHEWRYAAGVADTTTGRPARPGDRFRIASNTKAFVATVLLQLAGEHRLSLDDRVSRWLPEVRSTATVRQVLDHTSGIWDPTRQAAFWAPYLQRHDRDFVYRPRDVVAMALAHAPDFAQSTSWAYSNTNYLLAGLVIEAVTGRGAVTEIRDRLLRPLRLWHTSFPLTDPDIHGRHLHGYDLSGTDVTRFSPSYDWTAGAMISTLDDLARFERGLFGGHLLLPAQQGELASIVQRIDVPCDAGPVPVWETDGGGPGFTSVAVTTVDGARQLVLVGTVFDIGAELRGDNPVPASPALGAALRSAICP
jgi:D-alanyl-D-alanine carboxypeptidase